MLIMTTPRLSSVQALAGFRLSLLFIDGQRLLGDLSHDVQAYPGLQPLLDPEVFATAILSGDGWSVEWLGPDIQIGADTLHQDALAQSISPHPASAVHTAH